MLAAGLSAWEAPCSAGVREGTLPAMGRAIARILAHEGPWPPGWDAPPLLHPPTAPARGDQPGPLPEPTVPMRQPAPSDALERWAAIVARSSFMASNTRTTRIAAAMALVSAPSAFRLRDEAASVSLVLWSALLRLLADEYDDVRMHASRAVTAVTSCASPASSTLCPDRAMLAVFESGLGQVADAAELDAMLVRDHVLGDVPADCGLAAAMGTHLFDVSYDNSTEHVMTAHHAARFLLRRQPVTPVPDAVAAQAVASLRGAVHAVVSADPRARRPLLAKHAVHVHLTRALLTCLVATRAGAVSAVAEGLQQLQVTTGVALSPCLQALLRACLDATMCPEVLLVC